MLLSRSRSRALSCLSRSATTHAASASQRSGGSLFQAHDLGADGQGGHLTLARLSLEPEALVVDLREDRRRLPAGERSSRPPEGT